MENLGAGDLFIDVVDGSNETSVRLEWRGESTSRHPSDVLEATCVTNVV